MVVEGRVSEPAVLEPIEIARLKIELLAEGLCLPPRIQAGVARQGKRRLRVRSGSCGGLDVILPGAVYVNCPVDEWFAAESRYTLVGDEEGFFIRGHLQGDVPVELIASPAYYSRVDALGVPLSRIGQLCSDRLGIGLTNDCFFWRSPQRRCKFCSIGLNVVNELREKRVDQIIEVVTAAYTDPVAPARHLLLGGGTPDGPDAGAERISEVARAIKDRGLDRPIYAMIVPPEDNAHIDMLKEHGVDELGINIELYDARAAQKYIPGKAGLVGFTRYMRALEHAVMVFGSISTRSIMVVGLEDPVSTIRGVELLASMGVMPILSPFRAMAGTELERHPRPSSDLLWDVCVAATEVAGQYGMPLGPSCIPCQSNTLSIPGHAAHLYY